MAYISFQPKDYFNTVQWTGNASTNAITGVGFRPDWVWGKSHTSGYSHQLYDAVRGATEVIRTNGTNSETLSTGLTSFDSDGFTLGSNTNINASGHTVTGWNWKANGSGSSNTDGSINTTYTSASATSGFSVCQYTGTGANATVGHGMGVAPKMVIVKQTNTTRDWAVYHKYSNPDGTGSQYYLHLNNSDPRASNSAFWNNTDPTSSVFHLGSNHNVNGSGGTYIAYCFADIQGYSKFGSYTGNGNADGAFIYTGFKPAFVIIKGSSNTENWHMYDNKRDTGNPTDQALQPNTSSAEFTETNVLDFLSNGFKLRVTGGGHNGSGVSYIYMAFSDQSIVSSNGVPAVAR